LARTKKQISFNVNGTDCSIDARPYDSLNWILREELGLTGTKRGCDTGGCGSCTVLVGGKAIYSCMYPVLKAAGKSVETIEGLSEEGDHPLQNAIVQNAALQCAYCGPGIIMSAKCLLDSNPSPTEIEVREALVGNICRCTGYGKVVKSILEASVELAKGR
jgi:aerobic-type carbon monoxide dehydrogenase small subunit (CoxS/CutS family)